jgi:hypothetical protein
MNDGWAVRPIVVALLCAALASIPQAGPAAAATGPRSPDGAPLAATAITSSTARIERVVPKGAASIELIRDGRPLDRFAVGGEPTYTDHLLWPSTRYGYEIRVFDANGGLMTDATAAVTTPAQIGSISRSYSDASFWNTTIPAGAKLDQDSAAMIRSSILPWRTHTVIDNDDASGIPLAYSDPHSELYRIGCTKFGCSQQVSFRIPGYAAPSTGSDGHLAVYDPATNQELDMWQAAYDPTTDTWTAGSRSVTTADWGAACGLGEHCGGGGVAAGFNEWGGVIRPEEIAQGHIDHALVISMPHVRANEISCPATDIWASRSNGYANDPRALPLGAHIQLSPKVDVDAQAWPRWEKVVARALQTYGAYVADLDANITLRGEPTLDRGYDAWAKVGMTTVPHPSLANLPWGRFKVLQLQPC